MNISSVVVRSNPKKLSSVRAALAVLPGVEIQADCNDGRFALTIEDVAGSTVEGMFLKLHEIDGVLDVSLVYQYCDDAH